MSICDEGNHYFSMISRKDIWDSIDEIARCLKYQAVVEHNMQPFCRDTRMSVFQPFALKNNT